MGTGLHFGLVATRMGGKFCDWVSQRFLSGRREEQREVYTVIGEEIAVISSNQERGLFSPALWFRQHSCFSSVFRHNYGGAWIWSWPILIGVWCLVWWWSPMKVFVLKRRSPRPMCGCLASTWLPGATLLSWPQGLELPVKRPRGHRKGVEAPKGNGPFCLWLPVQKCHSGDQNGVPKLWQHVTKTTSEKERIGKGRKGERMGRGRKGRVKEGMGGKRREGEGREGTKPLLSPWSHIQTLFLYDWLVLLKSYRQQVWRLIVTTDEGPHGYVC